MCSKSADSPTLSSMQVNKGSEAEIFFKKRGSTGAAESVPPDLHIFYSNSTILVFRGYGVAGTGAAQSVQPALLIVYSNSTILVFCGYGVHILTSLFSTLLN